MTTTTSSRSVPSTSPSPDSLLFVEATETAMAATESLGTTAAHTNSELTELQRKQEKEIFNSFKNFNQDTIVHNDNSKKLKINEAYSVIDRIARTKEISIRTAANACATLFRRGAANAGAPDTMEIEIRCREKATIAIITRYDITMAMHAVVGHKTLRKMAEALAPQMLIANLDLIKENPLLDLKGDLSNRINRKLIIRKEPPLTREEEICCATYAQWMPNLNEISSSNRLKSLLDEDLNARFKKTALQKNKKSNNNTHKESKKK
jgi:hypothetical protein